MLEGGCYLAKKVSEHHGIRVTVMDMQHPKQVPDGIDFIQGNIKAMPFADQQFEMTMCTHTLEHVREPQAVIVELIRVTAKKLIIVMPKQREYLYSNDLHINYCPYMYSFTRFIGIAGADYREIGGDFVCTAEMGK